MVWILPAKLKTRRMLATTNFEQSSLIGAIELAKKQEEVTRKTLGYFLKPELRRRKTSPPPTAARAVSPLTAFCGPFPLL
jgi:hypothetical protein